MRICLVAHGFPPLERTGVENYTASLAGALAARGLEVEVFVPRVRSELPQLSVRRELQNGYGVTWITTNVPPRNPTEALDPPGVDTRFADFLDRERPDVVHFQHFVKLGVGLVDAARKRRIPTVYTAHDYYPICHRYTLLRPDLARCATIGDSMVCARCDLAASFLNRAPGLGDYQMGALADQLDGAAQAGLKALLEQGEPGPAGMTHADLDAAFDRRQVLDGRRAEAYGALDCILAPTQFLAARLREGGIDPERLRVVPYGIDTGAPRAAAPILRGERVRFGFLSGMSKHKGAHVLLDAFERMGEPAELSLFGGSSDTPYVERVRRRAEEVGAVWRGPFDRGGLAACLSEVDVVVVPSTWYENQPIVILEAFAAGRPVIAPRLGAMPENVRDGVDGLLYQPDDPDDLARVMARCVREEGLVKRLAAGIGPVHDVAQQAEELERLYAELLARRAPRDAAELLPSLKPLAERFEDLERQPSRALFERAARGLAALRAGLGGAAGDASAEDLLVRAFGDGSKSQESLRDRAQEADWMHATLAEEEREVAWMRGVLANKDETVSSLMVERDWLRGMLAAKEEELAYLYGLKQNQEVEVADLLERIGQFRAVGERMGQHLKGSAELGLAALETQQHVLGAEVRPLLDILRRSVDEGVDARERGEHDTQMLDALIVNVRVGLGRLQDLERELAWRRAQMEAASTEAKRLPAAFVIKLTGLGRRAATWRRGAWRANGGERP